MNVIVVVLIVNALLIARSTCIRRQRPAVRKKSPMKIATKTRHNITMFDTCTGKDASL